MYDNFLLHSSWNEKYFTQNCRDKRKSSFYVLQLFSRKSYHLCDKEEKYGTAMQATCDNIIRRMNKLRALYVLLRQKYIHAPIMCNTIILTLD